MKERIARAIAEAVHGRPVTGEYMHTECTGSHVYWEAAQAVLDALMEPTEEMVEAGFKARERGMNMAQSATATWQAMITVAKGG